MIALGICACFGGVPTMKRFLFPGIAEKVVYKGKTPKGSIAPMRLERYVHVDFMLRGCLISQDEFIEADIKEFIPSILGEPKERIVLDVERLIRACDLCISCAIHFLQLDIKKSNSN